MMAPTEPGQMHTAHAFHYATGQPAVVQWNASGIISITDGAERPPHNLWLAPPIVDLQINGYAGVDFQRDEMTAEQLLLATRALRRDGCAHYLLTLITDEWPKLISRLKHIRTLRQQSAELRQAILGWHVEGPFLSEKPGFCGAHNPAVMLDPSADHIRALRAATEHEPVLLTLAPERPGALEAIRLATGLGMRVSLGHTDATADTLHQAIAAGATGFTHLANGCPRELDRHDNILWRALEQRTLTVSFIPDGIHVSPAPFRLLHKLVQGPIYYTTDAMAAAGAPPGRYTIGSVHVEVGHDQIVRQPGRTNFAGSALRPVQGVFRAAEMLNAPWQECWRRFSEAPAQFIGVQRPLRLGAKAFCLVDPEARTVRTISSPGD